jgi:hypothetical protein
MECGCTALTKKAASNTHSLKKKTMGFIFFVSTHGFVFMSSSAVSTLPFHG